MAICYGILLDLSLSLHLCVCVCGGVGGWGGVVVAGFLITGLKSIWFICHSTPPLKVTGEITHCCFRMVEMHLCVAVHRVCVGGGTWCMYVNQGDWAGLRRRRGQIERAVTQIGIFAVCSVCKSAEWIYFC